MHGIDRNEADSQVFVEVLVSSHVATSALEPHLHVELAALTDGRDVDVLIQYLYVAIRLNHARSHDPGGVGAQVDGLRRIPGQLERDLLQVQDDVGRVFDHAGDRLELVQHAFDL